MQIPFDVVLQGGAVVVLLLWVWDLRQERNELKATIKRFLDAIEVAPKSEPPR